MAKTPPDEAASVNELALDQLRENVRIVGVSLLYMLTAALALAAAAAASTVPESSAGSAAALVATLAAGVVLLHAIASLLSHADR